MRSNEEILEELSKYIKMRENIDIKIKELIEEHSNNQSNKENQNEEEHNA